MQSSLLGSGNRFAGNWLPLRQCRGGDWTTCRKKKGRWRLNAWLAPWSQLNSSAFQVTVAALLAEVQRLDAELAARLDRPLSLMVNCTAGG